MTGKVVELDVREDIWNGRDPFARIMSAVASLGPDDQLLLVAPFEPVPLFNVMEKHGFSHAAKPLDGGAWEVLFIRQEAWKANPTVPQVANQLSSDAQGVSAVVELDARGLEPPQPMVRILEALETLPLNARLRARTDRRPMHLYDQLERRGFMGETKEKADGSFVTEIRRTTSP